MAIQYQDKTGRNHPCPCGSGFKFKHCHGDPVKLQLCNEVANAYMVMLIEQEKNKPGLVVTPNEGKLNDTTN